MTEKRVLKPVMACCCGISRSVLDTACAACCSTISKYGESLIITKRDDVGYSEARDYGIESIRTTFRSSKCSEDCLEAQLDEYYKTKCKVNMAPVAGKKFPPGSDAEDGVSGFDNK